jgi:translation elongation factor EF-1alpha
VLDKLKAKHKHETTKYYCIIIDVPKHNDIIKNMIANTSQANYDIPIFHYTTRSFKVSIFKDRQTQKNVLLAFIINVK